MSFGREFVSGLGDSLCEFWTSVYVRFGRWFVWSLDELFVWCLGEGLCEV